MQTAILSAKKFALILAHGFAEAEFIQLQKLTMQQNIRLKVVSAHSGLVNSQSGAGIGMSFPVDAAISETLAMDYDGMIILSGEHHLAKLEDELHTGRLLRAAARESMPIMLVGDAANLPSKLDIDMNASVADLSAEVSRDKQMVYVRDADALADGLRHLADAFNEADLDESEAA